MSTDGIDRSSCWAGTRSDLDDAAVLDRDIAGEGRATAAIDEGSSDDPDVKHGILLHCKIQAINNEVRAGQLELAANPGTVGDPLRVGVVRPAQQ